MEFTVYYADGSTFEGMPENAPTDYVICIAIPPKPLPPDAPEGAFNRWTLLSEVDMYIYLDPPEDSWHEKGWHGFDKYEDLKRHLKLANLAKGEVRAVLDGVQIRKAAYDKIILRAERAHNMTRR